jgi:hypothetical protein
MCGQHLALRANIVPTPLVVRVEYRMWSHVGERGPCNMREPLTVAKVEVTFRGRLLLVGGVVELVGEWRKSLTGVRAQVWRLLANVAFKVHDGGRWANANV